MISIVINCTSYFNQFNEERDIRTIEIEDYSFDGGGFGSVYHCVSINNNPTSEKYVVKIFNSNTEKSFKHSIDTSLELVKQLNILDDELKGFNTNLIKEYPAFIAAPLVVFEGMVGDKLYCGTISLNLKEKGYIPFFHLQIDETALDKFEYEVSREQKATMAYHLVRGLAKLKEVKFLHADLKAENVFVNIDIFNCALIDYDSGAFIYGTNDIPTTFGNEQDWWAPEIRTQKRENPTGHVKINYDSEYWAIAVAIHYLLFNKHPFFFLTEHSPNSFNAYRSSFRWPNADFSQPYMRKDQEDEYNNYFINILRNEINNDIADAFEVIFNEGFEYDYNYVAGRTGNRTSFQQWELKLRQSIIPTESRATKSELQRIRESELNPAPPLPNPITVNKNGVINHLDFERLNELVIDIVENDKSLINFESEIIEIEMRNYFDRTYIYKRLEEFLMNYYRVISDGKVTMIERKKMEFEAEATKFILPATLTRILLKY